MAPEAWRGEAAGAQSDVYSFGALLYELCAGHPPHNFDQLEDISRAARETDVRPLSTLVPTVNRRLAGMIDRCLRREPGERYPTAELLQLELEGLAAELAVPTAQTVIKQALRQRWRLTALAAVVLLASPILVIRQLMHAPASAQVGAGSRGQRQAVAILGLLDRGAGREHAGFAAALSDLLGAELAVGERLRRIPADSVARMQTELRLPLSEQYSPQQLARIRQNMDADLLLTGSYAAEGAGRLHISIFVLDVQTGSQRALASVAGSPGELFGLVARTGRDRRRQLGLAELSSAQQAELRASRPANPQLAQLYAQGRERLRHFDAVGARPLLEQVATGDVDYPLGHLAMAEVWTQLGYEEKAKAEAKRAFELASNLPREDRHLIEAKYREASKDWDKAITLYRSLQTFFPDALDYGLALASAQQSSGDIAAAQTTLRELRARLPRAGSDPRVDILQAKLTLDGGDPMAALALFDKATRQGEDNGAPLLIARARLEAAYALESTGQHDRALQYAKTAQDLFAGAGDRGAAADALMAMGAAYMFQGDFGRALATADDALALLLEIQNSSLSAAHLCNMAQLLAKRGDLALARSRAEGGLLLARELGLKETIGGNYLIIGWISLLQGQPDQALRAYAQAETIFNELADPRMIAWIQWHIGQALFAKGDLAQSRKHHDEALAIREKHGLKGFAAESRAALAALAIEEGRAAEAETLALAAAEQFAEEQQADNEAWARTLLAEARVAQGRVAEGLRELERARQQSATTQNAVIGFLVRRKNLELAAGNPKNKVEISRALDSLLEETSKLGFLAEQLEIKLLKQRAVLAASSPVEPGQTFQDIAKQADTAGLGLIAIKANKFISKRQN